MPTDYVLGAPTPNPCYVSQAAAKNEGEGTTPTIQNTQNPVFAHTTVLPVATPNAWGQVCGSSAALVFRVWQRLPCTWWGGTPAEEDDIRGQARVDASRLSDKLIGSAVVGLDILRGSGGGGAGGGREGQGLHEINGWYHVLDELQRSQGQLKVCANFVLGMRLLADGLACLLSSCVSLACGAGVRVGVGAFILAKMMEIATEAIVSALVPRVIMSAVSTLW